MASIPERVSALETNVNILFQRQRDIAKQVDHIDSWRDQMIGAAKEGARFAGIRLAAAGIILTTINVVIALFHYH